MPFLIKEITFFRGKFRGRERGTKKEWSPKQQKAQITKYPNLQNIQGYKISKVTKCPKIQNVQSYEQNVQR